MCFIASLHQERISGADSISKRAKSEANNVAYKRASVSVIENKTRIRILIVYGLELIEVPSALRDYEIQEDVNLNRDVIIL